MLAGQYRGQRLGSGTDGSKLFDLYRTGKITDEEWSEVEGCIARTSGHCTVMGTASTMTSLAEALGMTLPGLRQHPRAGFAPQCHRRAERTHDRRNDRDRSHSVEDHDAARPSRTQSRC